MRRVYVIDCHQESGYVLRVPLWVARLLIWRSSRTLDYVRELSDAL